MKMEIQLQLQLQLRSTRSCNSEDEYRDQSLSTSSKSLVPFNPSPPDLPPRPRAPAPLPYTKPSSLRTFLTPTATMSGIPQTFWSSPVRYLRWAAHEKPAIFWSIIIGGTGPVILAAGRPFREWIGDEIPKAIPGSYPGKCCFLCGCGGVVKKWEERQEMREGAGA